MESSLKKIYFRKQYISCSMISSFLTTCNSDKELYSLRILYFEMGAFEFIDLQLIKIKTNKQTYINKCWHIQRVRWKKGQFYRAFLRIYEW